MLLAPKRTSQERWLAASVTQPTIFVTQTGKLQVATQFLFLQEYKIAFETRALRKAFILSTTHPSDLAQDASVSYLPTLKDSILDRFQIQFRLNYGRHVVSLLRKKIIFIYVFAKEIYWKIETFRFCLSARKYWSLKLPKTLLVFFFILTWFSGYMMIARTLWDNIRVTAVIYYFVHNHASL